MHLAGVDAARGHRHHLVAGDAQCWSKNMPCSSATRVEVLAADVVVAAHRRRVAFELADDGAGVDVVDAGEAHPFGDDAERDAVVLLPRVGDVAGAVQVQDHVVLARPFRHRLDRGVADDEVDHDDDGAELLGEFGALVHVLHRRRR